MHSTGSVLVCSFPFVGSIISRDLSLFFSSSISSISFFVLITSSCSSNFSSIDNVKRKFSLEIEAACDKTVVSQSFVWLSLRVFLISMSKDRIFTGGFLALFVL